MADVQVTSAELKDGVLTVTGSAFTKTTTTLYVNGVETPFEAGADFDGTEITVSTGLPPEGAERIEVWAAKNGVESAHVDATKQDSQLATDQATAGDPQTGDTGSAESPGTTTTTAEQHEPIQVEGQDLSESERQPQPEPDHTAYQAESVQQAAADQENQGDPFDPGGDVHQEGYKTADPNQTPGDLVEDDLKTTSDATAEQINQAGVTGAASKMREANEPDREPLKEGEHLPGKDFRFKVENTKAGDLGKVIGPRDPYPKDNPPDPADEFERIHGYRQGSGEQEAQMDANPKT